jgi:hypothetical protein
MAARQDRYRRGGLLASSGAMRLRAEGLELSSCFRRAYPYVDWFLGDPDDVRSSYRLEVAATEFECQGLELDFACLCWAGDMVVVRGLWQPRRFSGNRWMPVRNAANRGYALNKYRVLLTRAREGLLIWVPKGSMTDITRNPSELDEVARCLVAAGAVEIQDVEDTEVVGVASG